MLQTICKLSINPARGSAFWIGSLIDHRTRIPARFLPSFMRSALSAVRHRCQPLLPSGGKWPDPGAGASASASSHRSIAASQHRVRKRFAKSVINVRIFCCRIIANATVRQKLPVQIERIIASHNCKHSRFLRRKRRGPSQIKAVF